ncbi:MAG: type II toxin-antitoxin system RelE/ParE family toxin [Flavobacteriia bacterium]|nr:type II toxin-antitoxin system RelE/ParE family toxin [Flavobacteriia bacterium]
MKKFKILILNQASEEFEEAFEYYKEINPKIAKKFFNQTNIALNDLKKNPFYQIRYDDFRMKIVKKFPYIIHYIVDENSKNVTVYGIRNSYQNPDSYPKK